MCAKIAAALALACVFLSIENGKKIDEILAMKTKPIVLPKAAKPVAPVAPVAPVVPKIPRKKLPGGK